MKEYIATQGERLDQIVFTQYNTLNKDVLNIVLSANKHLLNKIELDGFDIVYLPDIQIDTFIQEEKTLW